MNAGFAVKRDEYWMRPKRDEYWMGPKRDEYWVRYQAG